MAAPVALPWDETNPTTSPAISAAKDIAFGSVRTSVLRYVENCSLTIMVTDRGDNLQGIRAPFRSHKSQAPVPGVGRHSTVRRANRLSSQNLEK
jgi:hypothetical protein